MTPKPVGQPLTIQANGLSDFGPFLVTAVLPANGIATVVGTVDVSAAGCWRVTANVKYVDNVTGNIASITQRIIVHGGAAPVQVAGVENPSTLHTDIVAPPATGMNVVAPNVQVLATNPAVGANPVRVQVAFLVEFFG